MCTLSIFMVSVGCLTDNNIRPFSLTNIHISKENYVQQFLPSAHQLYSGE